MSMGKDKKLTTLKNNHLLHWSRVPKPASEHGSSAGRTDLPKLDTSFLRQHAEPFSVGCTNKARNAWA